MALHSNVSASWVSVGPLAEAELWTCRAGSLLVTLEAPTDGNQGVNLDADDSWELPAGYTVWYRRASSQFAALNREKLV